MQYVYDIVSSDVTNILIFVFFILRVNLVFLSIFISTNSMCKTAKLSPLLPSSTATRNSFIQTERVHGSVFDDHTRHFQMLVRILKYNVSIFYIIPINPSAALPNILYIKHTFINIDKYIVYFQTQKSSIYFFALSLPFPPTTLKI